jgi:hypothetical protein
MTLRMGLSVHSFLKSLKKMKELITLSLIKRFGQGQDGKKATEFILVVTLTISIYIFLFGVVIAMTLLPGLVS